jgi:hypothetical protein
MPGTTNEMKSSQTDVKLKDRGHRFLWPLYIQTCRHIQSRVSNRSTNTRQQLSTKTRKLCNNKKDNSTQNKREADSFFPFIIPP